MTKSKSNHSSGDSIPAPKRAADCGVSAASAPRLRQAVQGDSNNDSLLGGYGDDTLYGDAGADYLDPGYGADRAFGGTDNDTFFSATDLSADLLDGEAGSDTILGTWDGSDTLLSIP